jgi:nitroreductase
MSPLDSLLSRSSVSPRTLVEPGPSEEQLTLLLRAAARAPDHGRLRPARFVVVRGPARARLGDLFADATRTRDPKAPDMLLERMRSWPRTAPLVLGVVARVRKGHAIAEPEQVHSAAAAAMNVLNAAHMLGLAGMWVTGPNAYDPTVLSALGVGESETFLGFIGIGTAPGARDLRPAVDVADAVEWGG